MEDGTRRSGYLVLYLGPMGSGKSTKALEQATQFSVLGLKSAYVTSVLDAGRELEGGVSGKFASHNPLNKTLDKTVDYLSCTALKDIDLSVYDAVVIDESQFMSNLYVDVVTLVNAGKIVQVYGLSGDFKGRRFGETIDLIPQADEFHHMKAKCKQCFSNTTSMSGCFASAPFTDRLETVSLRDSIVIVGGMDMYISCCRMHHSYIRTQNGV